MYYAAVNSYANETSPGFANTWSVIAFESKKERNEYVANSTDMATCTIKRKEIREYVGERGPLAVVDGKVEPVSMWDITWGGRKRVA